MALAVGGGIDRQPLPAALLRQLFPPVRSILVAAPYSSDDERAPLVPARTLDSSTSISSDDPASSCSSSAATAVRWPFGHVRDVFGAWTAKGHVEQYADLDIEMGTGFPEASSVPNPAFAMSKANSDPPRWASGRVGDRRTGRFQSNLGLNLDSSATPRQPSASSVGSTVGSMVNADTLSRQAAAGSASVVGADTASGQGGTTDWMDRFKGLLVAYVFVMLPIILFFFPRYDQNQNHPVLQNLMDTTKIDTEKMIILVFFVVHVTVGVLGVLLAHIAQGPGITRTVGGFTLWIIISVLAFMDYILMKTIPNNLTNQLVFISHFIITAAVICLLWFKYVWPSGCFQGGTRHD